jgi:hypothetical protein
MIYKIAVHNVEDPNVSSFTVATVEISDGGSGSSQLPFPTPEQVYAIADSAASILQTEQWPLAVTVTQTNADTEVPRPA